jgi:hypothetical protein
VRIPFIVIGLNLNTSFLQDVFHYLPVVSEGIKLACSNVSWWILGKTVAESRKLSWVCNIGVDGVLKHGELVAIHSNQR